ncbi:hypothetical protein [Bradyrhizobium ottawaense]|uniref:hypothetical protein n=1 Tax=Bradyrhizobium ottawaense TaxID=931866 RepID=UPI003513D1AA
MAITTERTSFTKDIQGRYLCNNLAEVDAWKSTGGRPFDFIIVGGGTFGSAIAEHLWFRQKQSGGGLRTLVVDAGLFTVPEHVQNTGIQGFGDPANPFFLDENLPQPEPPRNEVWGIPWKSTIPLQGTGVYTRRPITLLGRLVASSSGRGDVGLAGKYRSRSEQPLFRREFAADRCRRGERLHFRRTAERASSSALR